MDGITAEYLGTDVRKQIRAEAQKWLSEAISAVKISNFWKQSSLTFLMNRLKEKMRKGKKGEGKATRRQTDVSKKELCTIFLQFPPKAVSLTGAFQFYKDFSLNKNFKNYCMMLFFLHFKDMRHIKFVSLLWWLRNRIYSIEIRFYKYLYLGIEGFFHFYASPDVFSLRNDNRYV